MKQYSFAPAMAEQVKAKLRLLRDIQQSTNEWVKGVMQATAAANGCAATDEIQLTDDLSGIVVYEAGDQPQGAAAPAAQEDAQVFEPELDTRAL